MFCFFTLKIENTKGAVFELTQNTKDYVVADVQGLTRPPTTINTSASAGIDGSYFNSARIEQRNIVIDLILRGDIEANRQKLYTIFPAKTPCTVYFKNRNRDVKIKGFVETLEGDIFSAREQMRISIICPKPFWEDMQAIYDELSTIIHRFHFPFSIEEPIPISDYVGTEGVTVENKGDIEIGFLCKVYFRSKANPTLTKSEFQDPIPSDVLQRYAYIPLTIDEYNPETDTLHVTSTHQPSDSIGNRYITIGGTRYMERIYKTNQSGSTKTLDITRAEGVPAKDLRYFEHHWNDVSLWFEGTVSRVERPDNVPEDLSQSFVEVRGKRGDALAEVLLMPDECSVTVSSEHITVTINADLQSRNYTGLRIIIVSSDSVDVSGATGITRRSITYQWRSEISWYPCHFENFDSEKDIIKIYDGDVLRTDYSITTLTYENGKNADFIIFNEPIKSDISYEVYKSVSGEDIRHYSDRDIDRELLLVDHLRFYNWTTGQAFGLEYPFQIDDVVTINTKSGELGVTLDRGDTSMNLLNVMTGDSTWIKLAVGKNHITFSADTNPDFLYAVFETALLYGGI